MTKEKKGDLAYVTELQDRVRRGICYCGAAGSGGFCSEHDYMAKVVALGLKKTRMDLLLALRTHGQKALLLFDIKDKKNPDGSSEVSFRTMNGN